MKFLASRSCLAGIVMAASAEAQTVQQLNVIGHIARIYMVEAACKTLKANDVAIAVIWLEYKMGPQDPKILSALNQAILDAAQEFKGQPENVVCAAGLHLFGPTGKTFPNLLKSR